MLPTVKPRTLVLGAIALGLIGVTVYDYTSGIAPRRTNFATVEPVLPVEPGAPRSRVSGLLRETAELKYFLAHAAEIRARYQAIAAPYAEAVATFVTLYAPDESPQGVANKRLSGLLPAGLELSGPLVSEVTPDDKGALWLTATLSFASADSAAFESALLALGDPANGVLWKELNVTGDPDKRMLRASGTLRLLMVEQVE